MDDLDMIMFATLMTAAVLFLSSGIYDGALLCACTAVLLSAIGRQRDEP